jgi:hypothetical protein
MSRHGAREQRKLAKKKARRAVKRTQLARAGSDNPMIRFAGAERWPVAAALVPDNLWTEGLGQLVFARDMPGGHRALAIFLVDVFCLGVKDALWTVVDVGRYRQIVDGVAQHGALISVAPEYFSKLVHCAADYGQSLGFPPHPDFRRARPLLDGIDPSLCHEEFQFGKDGKPLYIRGPSESPEKARLIASRIDAMGGKFLIDVGDMHGAWPYAVFDEDYEDDDPSLPGP